MLQRLESRMTKIESSIRAKTRTIVLIEDENFYGNAHLLRRKAGANGGQVAWREEGAASQPDDEGDEHG